VGSGTAVGSGPIAVGWTITGATVGVGELIRKVAVGTRVRVGVLVAAATVGLSVAGRVGVGVPDGC